MKSIPEQCAPKSRIRGVTLVELVIVTAIMAVMLTLAIPSLRSTFTRNQLRAQATETSGALALARSEAITRGVNAGICASDDGATCSGDAADFSNFMIVFVDTDGGSDLDAGELILKSLSVHAEVDQTAGASGYFFRPSGFRSVNATANLDVCHDNISEQNQCRRISVAPSGAVTVTEHTGS